MEKEKEKEKKKNMKRCSYYEIIQMAASSICQIFYSKQLTLKELLQFDSIYIYFSDSSIWANYAILRGDRRVKGYKFVNGKDERATTDDVFTVVRSDSIATQQVEPKSIGNQMFASVQSKYANMTLSELEVILDDLIQKKSFDIEKGRAYDFEIQNISELLYERTNDSTKALLQSLDTGSPLSRWLSTFLTIFSATSYQIYEAHRACKSAILHSLPMAAMSQAFVFDPTADWVEYRWHFQSIGAFESGHRRAWCSVPLARKKK